MLLCALLLFLRRSCGDRSRILLMLVCAVSGLMVLLRIVVETHELGRVMLSPVKLKGGLLAILFYLLYPIEVIRPGWLNFKRALVLFSPWMLLELLFACVPYFRPLTSSGELIRHVGEFDVWVRLLALALVPSINFILFYVPHSWSKSSADNRWIRWYTYGSCGIAVLFSLSMLTGLAVVSAAHIGYCLLFSLVVTYQELFVRLRVPVETEEQLTVAPSVLPQSGSAPDSDVQSTSPLWAELNRLMDEEELWRSPDRIRTEGCGVDSAAATPRQARRVEMRGVIIPLRTEQKASEPSDSPNDNDSTAKSEQLVTTCPVSSTSVSDDKHAAAEPFVPAPPSSGRYLGVKTNLAAWAGTIMNVAADVQVGRHWSVELPVLWCPWYVSDQHAVKTFTIQPEGRYWLSKPGEGHFFGAHAHVGWFSVK